MKMDMKVTGMKELQAQLRYTAEKVPDNARKAMHRAADHILKEAKLNTPVDKFNLEKSIRKEVTYGVRGRLQINILVGGMMVDGVNITKQKNRNLSKQQRKRRVNVDQYAVLVHEAYETSVAYKNGPGPGTRAKMLANPGRKIGSKFLERALRDNRKTTYTTIFQSVVQTLKSIWGRMFK